MKRLGKLEEVNVRELWNGEASDFTPWLAKEDNISILADEIKLTLEVLEQEKSVGPFRADILCKDVATNNFVVIENQLERTDHNHLGQLLTYASGLDAVTIIWIAKQFTEEHRAVLDWLNRITDDEINFFGIEITAFKIGDSLPAPKFNIVSKPNDWAKSLRRSTENADYTPTKLMQRDYWQKLKDYLEDNNSFLKGRTPRPQHWYDFAVGKSGFYISATINTLNNSMRIELICNGENAKENFNILKNKYENDFPNKIGEPVTWNELPDYKISSIYIKQSADVSNQNDWENQHKWFMEKIEIFTKYFKPKIKDLK